MEPYLTRIGDVIIERVPPRNKDITKEPIPNQPTLSDETGEQENTIEDESIVDKNLEASMYENEGENKMEEDPTSLIPPDNVDEQKPIEEEADKEKLEQEATIEEKQLLEELEEGEVKEGENTESTSKNDEAKEEIANHESSSPNAEEKCAEGSEEMGPDSNEGGTKRKTEDRGSDGEQKQKKKRQRKSSGKEIGENEDSSDSDSSDSHDSKSDKDNKEEENEGKKKLGDRKLTNLRRNIREVMNESELDEETKAAQRQEMERLRRVQEQQKIIRDLQRQIMLQNKAKGRLMNLPNSSSLLRQCTITTTGGSSGQSSSHLSSSGPSSSSTGNQVRIPSSVLMKLAAAGGAEANKKVIEMLTSRKRTSPRPAGSGQEQSLGLTAGEGDTDDDDDLGASVSIISSRRNSIPLSEELVSDTDDEAEEGDDDIGLYSDSEDIITVVPRKDPLPMDRASILPTDSKPKGKDVVTISSSSEDDCMILSGGSGEESEPEDTTNSGMHTNDLFNVPDENGNVLINVGHPSDEQDIFLPPQIARVIKPHQIGGLRFLYDNVVESLDRYNNSPGFGCILAHSMGLGKTLQVIAFCDVFLRTTSARTVLCIMPINTLQNWVAEFNLWMPADPQSTPLAAGGEVLPRQFPLHVLNDSHKSLSARTKVIREWHRNGGVLLIGYELYRQLSLKHDKMRGRKKKRNMPEIMDIPEDGRNKQLWDDVHEALVKPGPDLVICDEGHRIKNSHASISHALKSIASKRRVVLTGYPLQNNLLEYWCMVDFVRPNYLGSKTEFCNMFERPIQNGQCIDSTPQDIRLMRYRAHVLHSLLEGFVQRRSHAVLQHTLPQKNEYVLLLRMTPFQRTLYDKFMNDVVRTKTVPNPLKAFSVCCKIWNHPDILYYFLKKQEVEDVDLDLEETAVPGAVPGVLGGTPELCKKLTPGRPSGKGRPRLNAANKKEKLLKPAASINPTQPTKLESDKLDGTKPETSSVQPPTTQASSQPPSQASLYPSFPNNYPNQYYDQPGFPDPQYPSQQPPYQDYYNPSYPNNPGQYYPDQYNSNNSAQTGYYPQQSTQNYNNQPYWSSGNYNQDGQTNYNSTQQNNYPQQQQQNPPQNSTSSTPYYSNTTNNYPSLMKPNSESTFPLPPRISNDGSAYNNDYPQSNYPYTNPPQLQNNTDTTYTGYNQTSNATPVQETKVNEVKTETVVAAKEEVKDVVEEKPVEEVKSVVDEVKVEDVVEKKENIEEVKTDDIEDTTDETGRKPPPASAIEANDLPPEGIRVPVRLEGKSMLEIGTNAYRASREEPSIPYDWATELLKGYEPGHLENCAKMEVFFCILEESMALGDRILLFSQSLFTLNLIEDFLQKTNLPGTEEKWARNVNYYRLDGSTSALDREKLINEYNSNPKIHLFLVSTRAGSLGINLVGANRVIVFDASWNPCHDTQAVCRVYRYGQRKPCFVYRLVMDKCLEKKIYDRQINKQGMADRVVDELNPDAHLSIREVSNLLYDSEPDTEIQDFTDQKDKYIDVVVQKLIERLSKKLSKEPFQHESLLVDRKEKKLSQAERRLAKRNYELEKQATLQPKYSNYSMGPQGTVGVGTSPGNSASGLQIRPIRMDGAKPIASVRPMQAEQGNVLPGPRSQVSSGPGRGRWIPAEVWQRQGMSAQEMTLPLDVVIPTNSPDRASIVLKAGQRVMVLKSPKGIYMQLENGKIIAIRTALKMGENRKPGTVDNKLSNTSAISSLLSSDKKLPINDGKDNTSPILGNKMSQQKPIFPLKSNSEITITPRGPSTAMKASINSTASIPPNPKPYGTPQDHVMTSSSVWRNEQRVQPTTKTLPSRSILSSNQSFSGPTKPFYHQTHQQDSIHRNSATVAPEMKDTSLFDTPREYSTSSTNYQTSKQSSSQSSNYPNQYSRNIDYDRSNTNYNSSSNYNNAQNSLPESNNLQQQQQQRHSMDSQSVMQQSHSMQRTPVTRSPMSHSTSTHHHAPITTLNIPNPTMSHQHHKTHTISHRATSNTLSHTPQIQSLPPTNPSVQQISSNKLKNKSEEIKSKSKPKPKSNNNKPETDPYNFQDDGKNKTSSYSTTTSSDKPSDYNNYQQYNDYYNSQQQQPYGMGYQQPSTQYPPEKNTGSKKEEEKKKIEKSSSEFPVTTASYSSTSFSSPSTTTSQSAFNSTSGGSIVTTPQTSTYPDPYPASQYGSSNYRYPSSSSTYPTPAYPNQFSSDSSSNNTTNSTSSSSNNNNNTSSTTSSLYSAFHRPEPFSPTSGTGLPGSDVASFLSHPFGLPSTAPHFPSTASQSSTSSPYYPQNVYPPTPSSYGRSPYPTSPVDPYHAYPTGFNPFLVPSTPASHYPLPTNPPNSSTDGQ